MNRVSLNRVAAAILGWQAGRVHREAYVGDVAEEYARRSARDPAAARRWLLRQLVSGTGAWAVHRLFRPDRVRSFGVLASAAAAIAGWMWVFNGDAVVGAVRSAPVDLRVPLAVAANWVAVVSGGVVLGRFSGGPPAAGALAAGVGAWAIGATWVTTGAPLPAVAWGLSTVAVLAAGYAAGRWSRPASVGTGRRPRRLDSAAAAPRLLKPVSRP